MAPVARTKHSTGRSPQNCPGNFCPSSCGLGYCTVVPRTVAHIILGNLHHQLQQRLHPSSAFGSSLIHLHRKFHSGEGHSTCLQLLNSLYGISVAPRLWHQHLSEALREEGFKTCAKDPCLLYNDTIMVVLVTATKTTSRSFSPTWNPKVSTSLARARSLTSSAST